MRRRLDPINVVGAVTVAVLLVATAYATVDAVDDSERGTTVAPADALVAAWERSRTGTYRATGTFEREAPDGRRLEVDVEVAQRPPARLLRQFGEVSGHRGDRTLECPAPLHGEALECSLGPPGSPFDSVVAAEVRAFETLVTGSDPLYEVRRLDGACWRMTRTRNDPRSGFGLQADLCFHHDTGALRSVVVDHGEIEERTVYDEITDQVRAEHLEP